MKYPLIVVMLLCLVWRLEAQPVPKNSNIVITNESNINSDKLEYSPAFYEDGLVFITTTSPGVKYNVMDKRINQNIMQIYRSQRDTSGILQKPELFAKEILSVFHEGPLTFDRLGQTVYFTRNNSKNGKLVRANDGIAKLKIYMAEKDGETWGSITELPFNENESNAAHPAISVEEDKLYFASDREGGLGGMDIYVVSKVGDSWGEPVNLGPGINTEGNEVFPYVHADGTLYFASNDHGSLGGLDLYYAKNRDGEWKKPVSLGKPFNSPSDDFGLIVDRDKKNGYFSSNRTGGQGGDDIYNFYAAGQGLEEELFTRDVQLIVSDLNTGDLLPEVQVIPLNLDKLSLSSAIVDADGNVIRLQSVEGQDNDLVVKLSIGDDAKKGLTDDQGSYNMKLSNSNYVIKLSKEGYQNKEIIVSEIDEDNIIYAQLEKAVDCVTLGGMVLNEAYSAPVGGATIILKEEGSDEKITITSDNDGNFNYCIKCNTLYTIQTVKGGFESAIGSISTVNVNCNSATNVGYTVSLGGGPLVLTEGAIIELSNIYYNFNDASIRPDARVDLNALMAIMKRFPNMDIELMSHTDSRGTEAYNRGLSQRRAENVVKYLVNHGIDADRVTAVGYGESQLRNNCGDGVPCSEKEHQYNRRTEFRVVRIGANVTVKYIDNPPANVDVATTETSTAPSAEPSEVPSFASFAVVAGTYKNAENARLQLTRIKNLGYGDAKIVKFGSRNLRSVCAGFFTTRGEAASLGRELQSSHKIETYIRPLGNGS